MFAKFANAIRGNGFIRMDALDGRSGSDARRPPLQVEMLTEEKSIVATCPECGTRLEGGFSRGLGRCMICLLRVGFDDAEEPNEALSSPRNGSTRELQDRAPGRWDPLGTRPRRHGSDLSRD